MTNPKTQATDQGSTPDQAFGIINKVVPAASLDKYNVIVAHKDNIFIPTINVETATRQIKENISNVFKTPLQGYDDKTPYPSLQTLSSTDQTDINKRDTAQAFLNDRLSLKQLDDFLNNHIGATPTTSAVRSILVQANKELLEAIALSKSNYDFNSKARNITQIYQKAANKLKEQAAAEEQKVDALIDDYLNFQPPGNEANNFAVLKEIYGANLDRQKLKESIKKQLNEQLLEEVKQLDVLKQTMIHACNVINSAHEQLENAHTVELFAKRMLPPEGIAEMRGTGPQKRSAAEEAMWATDKRYDSFGNEFDIGKDKISRIDFNGKPFLFMPPWKRTESIKQAMRERVRAYLAKYETIEITLSCYPADQSNDRYNRGRATTVWRAAIEAGAEPHQVNIRGYKPDDEDMAFYKGLRAKESYHELTNTSPGLHAFLINNMKFELDEGPTAFLKKAFNFPARTPASQLGDLRPPVLTRDECAKLRNIDWTKVKNAQDLKRELNDVRQGMGNSIVKDISDEEIRTIKADMITDPEVRDAFKNAKDKDKEYILDNMTMSNIVELNKMTKDDFARLNKELPGYHNAVNEFNTRVFGNIKDLKIEEIKFSNGKGLDKAHSAYFDKMGRRVVKPQDSFTGNISRATLLSLKEHVAVMEKVLNQQTREALLTKKTNASTQSDFIDEYNEILWHVEQAAETLLDIGKCINTPEERDFYENLYEEHKELIKKTVEFLGEHVAENPEIQLDIPYARERLDRLGTPDDLSDTSDLSNQHNPSLLKTLRATFLEIINRFTTAPKTNSNAPEDTAVSITPTAH